jgi:hypothetical protein
LHHSPVRRSLSLQVSATGTVVWAIQFGGPLNDEARGVDVDAQGE